MQPEGYTELKSETSDSLAKYVQSISGAQVSEQEARRLGRIIPSTKDADKTFDAKLKVFERIIKQNKENLEKAIQSGQPLKKLNGLESAIQEISKIDKSTEAGAGVGLDIDAQLNLIQKIKAKRRGK